MKECVKIGFLTVQPGWMKDCVEVGSLAAPAAGDVMLVDFFMTKQDSVKELKGRNAQSGCPVMWKIND
jgi:hypothetical protein